MTRAPLSILPLLTLSEVLEVTTIYSVSGRLRVTGH
jgi:hypothetical protein